MSRVLNWILFILSFTLRGFRCEHSCGDSAYTMCHSCGGYFCIDHMEVIDCSGENASLCESCCDELEEGSGCIPLAFPEDGHDMLVGPCSCGAWHPPVNILGEE